MAFALQPAEIDALGEFVVVRILDPLSSPPQVVRDLVARMARDYPRAPALAPVLVLSIAANGLGETLADTRGKPSPAYNLWRMAALLATDILAMQCSVAHNGPAGVSVADLARYWQFNDDFFQV